MTDERIRDDIVAATYREVAQERTPEHLDQQVLRKASSRAQQPLYARSMSWTRPLAWAATIALCLAITFEVSRGPALDAVVSESDIAVPAPAGRADQAAERLQEEKLRPAMALAPQKLEQEKKLPDTPVRRALSDQQSDDADEATASKTFAFEIKDADMLQRAENRARLQNGTNTERALEEAALPASSALAAAVESADASPAACSDEAKLAPESWLECIVAIEDAGDTAAANREKESLIEVFPDFNLP